jgi:hypothetical protein
MYVTTPPGYRTQITISGSSVLGIHGDEHRYEQPEKGVFVARDADATAPLVEIAVSGTFGEVYLA